MGKLCKQCKKPRDHNNPLISLCRECTYKKSEANKKQTRIHIKQVSSKNSNTPAKFSVETKRKILERDRVCIVSGKSIEEYHHCYFGMQANRGTNRNDLDQGVGLSSDVHRIIHHPSPKETDISKLYRAKCIEYLVKLK